MANHLQRKPGWRIAGAVLYLAAVSACGPMVHVTVEREGSGPPTAEDEVGVVLRVRTDGVGVSITNRGASPIDVLWQKAVLVDTEGKASGVLPGMSSAWVVPDLPAGEDVSRIPPGATLDGIIIPTSRVTFDPYYGWLVQPLLPVECGPIRCTGYHELVGKTVRLSLPMRVHGEEQVFDLSYRIADTEKSMRGNRPVEATLQ
jgi:hypothetical protein